MSDGKEIPGYKIIFQLFPQCLISVPFQAVGDIGRARAGVEGERQELHRVGDDAA